MNGDLKYGDVALGVEAALPVLFTSITNRGGGRAGPGKEDRDTASATPASFGNTTPAGRKPA
jgi:hypothetical protein